MNSSVRSMTFQLSERRGGMNIMVMTTTVRENSKKENKDVGYFEDFIGVILGFGDKNNQ